MKPLDIYDVDTVVAGGGVIGIAIARALAMAGREVWLLEKNAHIGEETSARNSEVIHAGIYYDHGSLKARHCVRGKTLLYDYCADRGVAHRRCGKLIVASREGEVSRLSGIADRARQNGVDDLELLDAKTALQMEPDLRVQAALWSPSTGIVDSHALMLSLLGDAEAHGATTALRAQITGGKLETDGRVTLDVHGEDPVRLRARSFINATGLWTSKLMQSIDGLPSPPDLALVKGNYFLLSRKAPFSRLIYPVPADGGLGVHLTLDLGGQAKFGPDTEWLDTSNPADIDYGVSGDARAAFADAIRQYWPAITDADLVPGYAGVRPKVAGADYPDFQIDGPDDHGLGPHVFLHGIESPGLTSCLSIADHVAGLLAHQR
ncbi:NAD(P)/FAD-dependent oxidoreductase [Aliiroseovarius sp. S1339]|uniref:NAD(P)/FAD-dependent oxidoreductase n=1 Tax=Aliiroseovarius sp. S1339 TaxID=2936990 RepID=UPI0020C17EEC|nr:NAD(P)/FAD-dependent oxidoreductase [Aliiroseovarius sp. S1339]MCK8465084.1 NAD(P)/FAD-dependent oxidoreductase [Aliiroseovarius sp. S1339]